MPTDSISGEARRTASSDAAPLSGKRPIEGLGYAINGRSATAAAEIEPRAFAEPPPTRPPIEPPVVGLHLPPAVGLRVGLCPAVGLPDEGGGAISQVSSSF